MRSLLIGCAWALMAAAGTAQVVDRVLARADGQAILASDLRLARAIGLAGVGTADDDQAVLRQLVDRQLMLAEVLRSQPAAPDAAARARALEAFVTRAGGAAAAAAALRASGVPQGYLERLADEAAWLDAYTRQRFGADPSAPARAAWVRDLRRRGRVECVVPAC